MPTVREQVFSAVVTALSGINGASPYQTKVDDVFPYNVTPDENIADDIVLGVFPRTFQVQRNQTRLSHGADCPAIFMVGIRGILKGAADVIEAAHSQFLADVERAIWANINLGINTNAVRIESLSFENELISKTGAAALATFLATLTVAWLTDPTNP